MVEGAGTVVMACLSYATPQTYHHPNSMQPDDDTPLES
jgi:hypothetical protein